jgi:hypothetical protein
MVEKYDYAIAKKKKIYTMTFWWPEGSVRIERIEKSAKSVMVE